MARAYAKEQDGLETLRRARDSRSQLRRGDLKAAIKSAGGDAAENSGVLKITCGKFSVNIGIYGKYDHRAIGSIIKFIEASRVNSALAPARRG